MAQAIEAIKEKSMLIQKEMLAELFTELSTAKEKGRKVVYTCLLYTSPSPRDRTRSRMPSSA